ncbi:MAG: SidJ-related pseudokinase [Thermodesulfobacteriota bacterium]|nr:SidJ-related pseudokinase [Thermodesulfobacteriota bacterium]
MNSSDVSATHIKISNVKRLKALSEKEIKDKVSDYYTKYFAVYHLQSLSQSNPDVIDPETIATVHDLLKDPQYSGQRQGLFIFRQAAETLGSIIIHSDTKYLAEMALSAIKNVLKTTTGYAHRACAETLGAFPLNISGPSLRDADIKRIPLVNWQEISNNHSTNGMPPVFFGRSLAIPLDSANRMLVLKFARNKDTPQDLLQESLWMEHLHLANYSFPLKFKIPRAMKFKNSHVIRIKNLPAKLPEKIDFHRKGYAIGFVAHKDYFSYPNDFNKGKQLTENRFKEVIFRNAWLLGELTSTGIIHYAPIPLFHNRVQRNRRRDRGVYEWFRAGRLDRWLESCLFPNFGLTGIRDFEHFVSLNGYNIYRHIGNHFLSLLLVTGSYFRIKDINRIGFDKNGKPIDTRDLFTKPLLKKLIQGIFLNYFHAFTKTNFTGELPLNVDELSLRMIEEMGVDRHMEEIFRVADQEEMTDTEFKRFLKNRNYSDEEINDFQKGEKDIIIMSGPHLGEFNHDISLPELIEAVETMSALCIAGKYLQGKNIDGVEKKSEMSNNAYVA